MCLCGSKVASSLRLRGPPPPVEMVLLMACTITACSRVGCRKEMRKEGRGRRTWRGRERREEGGGRGLCGGYSNCVRIYACSEGGTSPPSALPPPLICQVNAIMHCNWIYFWYILCIMNPDYVRSTFLIHAPPPDLQEFGNISKNSHLWSWAMGFSPKGIRSKVFLVEMRFLHRALALLPEAGEGAWQSRRALE